MSRNREGGGQFLGITPVDFESLQQQAREILSGLSESARAVDQMAAQLLSAQKSSSIGEQWVKTWGETVNKKTAAAMLGISPSQVTRLTANGTLKLTPDGRVLVRQAAEWANSAERRQESRRQTRSRGMPREKMFVP